MLAGFEVGVWEAEEEGGELGLVEEVGEEFHGVGAEDGDVLVGGWWGGGGGGARGGGVVVWSLAFVGRWGEGVF